MTVCEPIVSPLSPALFSPFDVLPELPSHFVRRERLERRLSERRGRRVTLVTGLAGSGKTVLVAGLARHWATEATAYLALRNADNNPRRFWRRLVATLRFADSEVGDNVLAALPVAMNDVELAEILAAETTLMKPAVLVLDGVQHLRNHGLMEAVEQLATLLPAQIHLIATSRNSLDGQFHRLRLHGDVNEINHHDLRFTDEEARQLLSSVTGQALASNDVARVVERTEGWAVGLTLAGLSVADGDGTDGSLASFSGASRLLDEYFQREVVRGEPAETFRFLVESTVLGTMTSESCAHVTGRADAGRLLEGLAKRGLFLLPTDGDGTTYRYHRLFAEYLQVRAAARQPEVVEQAHLRAAAWRQSKGDDEQALHHLVEARADDRALTCLAAMTVRQLDGTRPVGNWSLLSQLPDAYIESHPRRMYVMGAALLAQQRPMQAAPWLQRVGRAVEHRSDATDLASGVEMLWGIHDALLGNAAGVLLHQQRLDQIIALEPDHPAGAPPFSPTEGARIRPLAAAVGGRFRLSVAWARLARGESEHSAAALDAFVSTGGSPADLGYLSLRATLAYSQGRLREASTLSQQALALADGEPGGHPTTGLSARVTLAAVFRERNKLQPAEACLTEALTLCQQGHARHETVEVTCELIRVMIAQRRHEEALDQIQLLRYLAQDEALSERIHWKVLRTEVECRLAMRDIHRAEMAIRSLPLLRRQTETVARLQLLAGQPDRAERTLRAGQEVSSPLRARIERLVLLARAQFLLGRQDKAHGTLRRALDLGRPEHFVQVFVEDAPALATLLLDIADDRLDTYVSELAAVVKKNQSAVLYARRTPVGQLVEPLTPREREVLSHLARHLTLREIAAVLYLSHNTIKSHTRTLYNKLGAACRSEAVQTAQYHGLL